MLAPPPPHPPYLAYDTKKKKKRKKKHRPHRSKHSRQPYRAGRRRKKTGESVKGGKEKSKRQPTHPIERNLVWTFFPNANGILAVGRPTRRRILNLNKVLWREVEEGRVFICGRTNPPDREGVESGAPGAEDPLSYSRCRVFRVGSSWPSVRLKSWLGPLLTFCFWAYYRRSSNFFFLFIPLSPLPLKLHSRRPRDEYSPRTALCPQKRLQRPDSSMPLPSSIAEKTPRSTLRKGSLLKRE